MKTGNFKLVKVYGGVVHYAEVTAAIAPSEAGPAVEVAPEVFAWLKESYGPDACEWPGEGYRAAAVAGAKFALEHIAGQTEKPAVRAIIRRIHTSPVDTSPQDVSNATCMAVWQALGIQGEPLPFPIGNG
jgi:hypothetical protein